MSNIITFSGPSEVQTYRALVLKSGLKLYAKTRLKPNRMWTPTAMLRAATSITGTKYKRGQFTQAIADLETWLATRSH